MAFTPYGLYACVLEKACELLVNNAVSIIF